MNAKLEAKLKTLPRSAGVYFHKSKTGEIIYVGKAAVLKNRVRQYFQSTRDMDIKTRALVEEIEDTARAYNTDAEIFPMAHDMMLENGWEDVAQRILEWLQAQGI